MPIEGVCAALNYGACSRRLIDAHSPLATLAYENQDACHFA